MVTSSIMKRVNATSTKIILKPLRSVAPLSIQGPIPVEDDETREELSPTHEDPDPILGEEDADGFDDVKAGSSGEEGTGAENEADEDAEGEAGAQNFPRSRGRPRGRGRPPPTRPLRARGRGRGRGRKGKGAVSREDLEGEGDGEEGDFEDGRPWRKINDRVYHIEGDEFVTEADPKGDQKIDADGHLLGGRCLKCSTFTLPARHPTRQYMLAIDAARSSGFRDSLYYFRKNPLALKLSATQPEKEFLIQAGKLGAHLKTRSVTLVTARSAYKLHGAKMIIDGRWVTDDYYEDRALQAMQAKGIAPGTPVGELPDPTAPSGNAAATSLPAQASSAVSHGIYRAGGPTTLFGGAGLGPFSDGPHSAVRKSMLAREGLSKENWMLQAAKHVGDINEEFARMRKEARRAHTTTFNGDTGMNNSLKGKEKEQSVNDIRTAGEGVSREKEPTEELDSMTSTYEPHTSVMHYRVDMQPSRYRWERIKASPALGGTKVGNGAWGLAWISTCLEYPGPAEYVPLQL